MFCSLPNDGSGPLIECPGSGAEYSGFIDTLKGIAILLVVWGHYYPEEWRYGQYALLHNFIYLFHMPLFMVVSGYLYAHTKNVASWADYTGLLRKQCRRLLVPYMVLSVSILLLKLAVQRFVVLENPVSGDFWKFLLLNPMGGFATFLWYLYTLFGIYLIFPALEIVIKRKWVLTFLCLGLHFLPSLPGFFCLDLIARFLVYFCLGTLLRGYFYKTSLQFPVNLIAGILLLTLCYLSCLWPLVERGFQDLRARPVILAASLAGIMGCWCVASLFYAMRRVGVVFVWLGTSSAAIYLFHSMCMAPVKMLLNGVPREGVIATGVRVLAVCAAGVMGPVGLRTLCRRSRVLSWLFPGVFARGEFPGRGDRG